MKKTILCFVSTMLIAAPLLAAGTGSGKVTRVYTTNGGGVIIGVSKYSGAPGCSDHKQFGFDGGSAEGKNILANAMLAKANKLDISIRGTGKCETYSNREELRYIYLE